MSELLPVYPFRYCPYCGHPLEWNRPPHPQHPYCPRCQRFIYENPVPAVAVLAVHNQQVLIVQRGVPPKKGAWALPSGFLEMDESPEEAALRELREETGLTGRLLGLVDVTSEPSRIFRRVLVIGYAVAVERPLPLRPGDDAVDAKWHPLEPPPVLAFRSHQRLLESWLQKQKKPSGPA